MTSGTEWKNPENMSREEIHDEISKKGHSLNAQYWAALARINQLQSELTRRNILESSKNATTWSKRSIVFAIVAIVIAALSLLSTAGFFVVNYYSDKNWQTEQLKALKNIERNTLNNINSIVRLRTDHHKSTGRRLMWQGAGQKHDR